jgi:hypothetical protein
MRRSDSKKFTGFDGVVGDDSIQKSADGIGNEVTSLKYAGRFKYAERFNNRVLLRRNFQNDSGPRRFYRHYINFLNVFTHVNEAFAVWMGICFFLAAWLLGIIIDLTVFAPVALLLIWLGCKKCWLFTQENNNHHQQDPSYSRRVHKLCAEMLMFRCLATISILTFLLAYYKYPPELFGSIEWKQCYGIISAITFTIIWLWYKKYGIPSG